MLFQLILVIRSIPQRIKSRGSKTLQSKTFLFIIQGAFEVQGRLLHAKDGLALWNSSEDIELEALSNEATVLLIEQLQE